MSEIVTLLIVLAVAAALVVWLLHALYERSSSEHAFVRTGLGGEKVVISGGALVLPIVHRVTPVSFALTRMQVSAEREDALITLDRLRVDVEAEFFLRVAPRREAVAAAAMSLGRTTAEPERLASFFESEFVSAMRAVAARMTLDEIHEDRVGFVEAVRERAGTAIAHNGIELVSVAVRNLDQTDLEHFNPANRFDAEGLTQLIEVVEERRQMRNDIEQRSVVAIRERNLEAERQTLALERESQMARFAQEEEVERSRAEQRAAIARAQAEREAEASTSRIGAERATEAERIASRRATEEAEIAAAQETERARLAAERETDEARIAREEALRRREIARGREIEILELETRIDVLAKASEAAAARISANDRLIEAARAEEGVATARDVERATREARLAGIAEEREAENAALHARVRAEAERLRNEADNVLSDDARTARLRHELIERLEGIVRETVKPIEKIDGIKVVQMSGAGGGSAARSPTDEVIDSALRYRVQAPMIDELMREIGVEGANVAKAGDVFRTAKDAQSISQAAAREHALESAAQRGPNGKADGDDR